MKNKDKIRQVVYGICDLLLDAPIYESDLNIVASMRSDSMYIYSHALGKIRISDHENIECEYDNQVLVSENSNINELVESLEDKYYESNRIRC